MKKSRFLNVNASSRSALPFLRILLALLLGVFPALAQVTKLELKSDRTTTVPGVPALITAKAFDASNNPVASFSVTFTLTEGSAGGNLGAKEDCAGEASGSLHCVKYHPADTEGVFHVNASLDADPTISALIEIEVVHCAPYPADGGDLTCTGPIISPNFDHKWDLRLAVICLEPQDFLSQNDTERQQFRNQVSNDFFGPSNSVKRWFDENALNQAHLIGSAADVYGPYSLAHSWGDYFQADGQIRWGDGQGICFQDEGAVLADPDLDYTQYNRVFFVVKGDSSHQVWGWTNSIWNKHMTEGCIKVTACRAGSQSGWQVYAHEFTHSLWMANAMGWTPDLYGGADLRKVGDWDMMCNHSPGPQNTMAIKYCGEWLPGEITELTRPVWPAELDQTIVLSASELPETDPTVYKTAKIPFTDSKTIFIEARQKVIGNTSDQNLPNQGVIITEWTINPASLGQDRAPILLYGGPLVNVGDTYELPDPANPANYLKVELTAKSASTYTTRIRWKWKYGPDPYITPWGAPPYESVDIWNDSPMNNVGGTPSYVFTDGAGKPILSGDPPSYDVANTIYAKIHNSGNEEAQNVQVLFYWLDPNIGADISNWNYIGFSQINIPAGGETITSTLWTPPHDLVHVCVLVVVNALPGELNPTNNQAQENFELMNSPHGSPYAPVTSTIRVFNPLSHPTFVRLAFNNLEAGWKIKISHRYLRLQPGEAKPVDVIITPPPIPLNDKIPNSTTSISAYAYRPGEKGEEQMVHLGGVTLMVQCVNPAPTINLNVAPLALPLGTKVVAQVTAPPLVSRPIAVVFNGPNGEEFIKTSMTGVDHAATFDFYPTQAGPWTAQARFMGDKWNDGAASNKVMFWVSFGKGGREEKAGWTVGYFMGGYWFRKNVPVDSEILYGFRLGIPIRGLFRIEPELILASPFDADGNHGFLTNFNLLANFQFHWVGKFDLLTMVGFGYLSFTQFAPATDVKGWDWLLGIGLKFNLLPRVNARVDWRYLDMFNLGIEPKAHHMIQWGVDIDF